MFGSLQTEKVLFYATSISCLIDNYYNAALDTLESTFTERERLLEKLQGFDGSERMTTEDDVRAKREQVGRICSSALGLSVYRVCIGV